MVYVIITNELKPYEADIRDLCLAFFPMQKIKCVEDVSSDIENDNSDTKNIIQIKDFFEGTLSTNRLENKSEIKRQLYNYLSYFCIHCNFSF